MRVRIPDKRRDTAFFDDIADRLSRWQGVERVEANPLTASILFYCSDPHQLLADITARNDLLAIDFNAARRASETLRNRAAQHFGSADAALRRWTEGELDIRGLLFIVYLVGGVYQLLQGRVSASAPSLLWRAGSLIGLWDVWPAASSGTPAEPTR
jgi:Heavy metal associated domain 2